MRSCSCFSRSVGGKKCREWSESLGCGTGGDVGGVGDGDDVVAFGVGVGDIRLSKKKTQRGSNAWRMLLPLNP